MLLFCFMCVLALIIIVSLIMNKFVTKKCFENLRIGDIIWTSDEPIGDNDYVLTNPVKINYIEQDEEGNTISITLDNGEKFNYKEFCDSDYVMDNQ